MAKRGAAAGPVEGPWALPDGWRWERLPQAAAICDHLRRPINNSERLKRNEGKADNELFPYYGATGQAGVINGYLADGDYILLGEDGAPFLDPFKAKAYAVSGRFWVNNHAHVLKGKPHLDTRLLLHWLNTIRYEPFVNGTTRLKLTQGAMMEMPVPVPPENLQSRLATRIDELFVEIDDGEAALARARDDLATWRKALLKAAVTGELTADWRAANPPGETGADFLIRILTERRARWDADQRNKGRRYAAPAPAVESALPTLPDDWAWSSMGQLLDRIEAGLNVKCVERPPHGAETGLLKISAVTWWRFNERASKTLVQSHTHPDQWLIAEGDLLVSRANTRELVGAPAIVEGLSLRLMLSDKVLRLAMPTYLRWWTFYVMRSPFGRSWIEAQSTGNQLSMRNISQDALRAMPIPLPPRAELDYIVELLIAASSQHETTAGDVDAFDVAASTLRQSILAAAFRGELA